MIAPPTPDDALRVRSLRRLGLLDTEPEERFDCVTRLARRVFKVRAAAVTLVDADRAWLKSAAGIEGVHTPRDQAFCAHTILEQDVFLVEDAHLDPRFADYPSVTGEPHIRFYAGVSLTSPDGEAIGALCIIDTSPRHLDPDEQLTLRDLAAMVERELAATQVGAVDDDLTGLANGRGFQLLADKALALCARRQVDAVLVYADVDGLQPVNDLDGHEAGNHLITRAAEAMAAAYRHADVVAHLGRDDFVALLADFDAGEDVAVGRLADAVEAANAHHPGRQLSLAVGTSRWRHDDPVKLATLVERARTAMIERKRRRDGAR